MFKRWRSSLAVKIFIWFWLVIASVALAAFVTLEAIQEVAERPANAKEQRIFQHKLQKQKAKTLDYRIYRYRLPKRWQLFAVDLDQVESHIAEEVVDEFYEHGGELTYLHLHGTAILVGQKRGNKLYVLVKKAHWRSFLDHGHKWVLLLVIILVISLLSGLLAWYLTAPIRRLQRATQQLAKGDFAVKELRDKPRQDELGLLAQDFVVMADDLENLLASHQQLLRDVSHELRSPLTRLRIALALAQKKDEQQGLLASEHGKISRAVDQVEYLIANILDLAKLQQTHLLDKESFDLVAEIKEWLADAEPELEDKGLNVEFVTPNSLAVCMDKTLIQRAFDNVLRNAIRYSPERGSIHLCLEDKGAESICLAVSDQGPGVEPQNLEKIFDAFVQEDSTRHHDQQGYGIGLALVKRIAELHKGQVIAQNLPAAAGSANCTGLQVTLNLAKD